MLSSKKIITILTISALSITGCVLALAPIQAAIDLDDAASISLNNTYRGIVNSFQNSVTIDGVSFLNGTLINTSTDEEGNDKALTIGDKLRVDGEIFRIEAGGDNPLRVADTIMPVDNDTYSLGTESFRFKDLYLSGMIGVNGDINADGNLTVETVTAGTWNGSRINISDYTNLAAGSHLALNNSTLAVSDDFLLNNGDTATGDYNFANADFLGASPLAFEGTTNNNVKTTFAITNPTSNRTVTFKDESGTVAYLSDISGGSYWTDGGTYLYPTAYESMRVYDSGGTDYIDIAHDGTDANFTFAGTTALDIDSPITGATWNGNAIDISDYTNLAAGTNITLDDDTLNVDDVFLLNSGDTGTGNYDFTGAEFLGGSPLVFEGSTDNNVTTTFAIAEPTTANKTITFKDETGTVAFLSDITGGYWSDGGTYLFPTNDESARVYGPGASTKYIDIAHDDTDATISFDGSTTALNINIGTIDLSNQTVGIPLNTAENALSFDSGTLSIDASADEVGIGDTTPDHKLDVAGNIGLDASSYINFGDTDGDSGYGFKDNGGTMQYKNSGGSWANIGSGGGTPVYGELYVSDNSSAQAMSSAYAQYTTSWAVGNSSGTTPSAVNSDIAISTTGYYLVTFSGSFSGSNSETFTAQIQKNNGATDLTNLTLERKLGTGGDVGSTSISGIGYFESGDTVELWIKSATDSKTMTMRQANLSVELIH
ncbi:hypothetical protein ACFL2B_03280 [Patescibacteria group bacterium]